MSPISSISASAVSAIANGSRQLDQDAQQIADPDSTDVTGALIDTSQSLQIAQAGADVISASNQMLGTLLDVFA
jgi:hypothetical protein